MNPPSTDRQLPAAIGAALESYPEPFRAALAGRWADYAVLLERAALALPPVAAADLLAVWNASRFVADATLRDPRLLDDLAHGGDLGRAYDEDELAARARAAAAEAGDADALGAALRRLRRREMVRIAWRDIAGHAPLAETLAELTALAEACIEAALERLHDWLVAQWGQPVTSAGEPQRLTVLGMGKLGARELNFSSDIDLILAYPELHDDTEACRVGCERFFRRLVQQLVQALDAATVDGFVFRVDLRLRPFGGSGPLAMSHDAMEEYYQNQGREWERYALIKARTVAGDRVGGEALLASLRPFVYRRYVDFGVFESLREMKGMIRREVQRKGLEGNVKLGSGGIREIEFVGQAFQLVHGGRVPELRSRGILGVLATLARLGQLPEYAVTRLHDAYHFLRRTENRLQEYEDRQTHLLPGDETERRRLALAMGFADWAPFAAELGRHRAHVSDAFEQLFALPQAEHDVGDGDELAVLWPADLDTPHAALTLRRAGFVDPEAALDLLLRLRESRACRAQSAEGQRRLARLMPLLLGAVGGAEHPVECLRRLLPLLETVSRRSAYIALLSENPMALSQLVRLVSASPWIALRLTQYPLLLDELLDPRTLYAPPDHAGLEAELGARLEPLASEDLEQQMETMRHFKRANVLRVAAADVAGAIPLMVVSDHLTWIAETVLGAVQRVAWEAMVRRHGEPRCRVDGVERRAGFGIIAYGKLGGIELGYVSDLDIVFLHDSAGEAQVTDGAKSIDNAVFFTRLAQRVIHVLTTMTASGELYPVDTRLRPSGSSGLMVSDIEGFRAYQASAAWTWEQQALVRARPIAGDAGVAECFAGIRAEMLARERDPATLRMEVREMRERMRAHLDRPAEGRFHLKQGAGGIADIEFIVQYLVLAHAADHPALLAWTDNVRLLETLAGEGLLGAADAGLLADAYRAYREAGHHQALQDAPGEVAADEFADFRAGVQRLWQALIGDE